MERQAASWEGRPLSGKSWAPGSWRKEGDADASVNLFGATVAEVEADEIRPESEEIIRMREMMKTTFKEGPVKVSRLPAERREVLAVREARRDAHQMVEKFMQLKSEGAYSQAKREAIMAEYEKVSSFNLCVVCRLTWFALLVCRTSFPVMLD